MGEPGVEAIGDTRKRKADGRWYKQKFRDSWLLDDRFKNWLVSVPQDPYRARCRLCKAELRAGKSELEKHAKTKHHRDMVDAVEEATTMLGFTNQVIQPDVQSSMSEASFPPLGEEAHKVESSVVRQPKVQCYAPEFKGEAVVENRIQVIHLSDFLGKYLLLLFHSDVFSLACPTELVEHSERIAEFRSLNVEVVAVSTDSCRSQLAWTNTPRKLGGLGKINVFLLSDFTKQISRDYDVLVESTGYPKNATFVIDPRGVVRYTCVHDFGHPRRVDSVLQCLRDTQYVDKQCEATSASWEPNHHK
ncbi:peroxiredoxin-like [Ornithodoros turicata]|uniref:peroxiredoxin-like n=1 Tax=Ornithodoros turicata TaxID=34597 RepID=UPI003138D393